MSYGLQGNKIHAYDTKNKKYVPIRTGSQVKDNSLAITLASDDEVITELNSINSTLDIIGEDITGTLKVSLKEPLTAFGELQVAEPLPIAQIDAIYGIRDNVETFIDTSPGSGSVSSVNGNFICQTGTSVGGYGIIRSRRAISYRPGQGNIFRFTAIFDSANATALSLQAAGAFNSISGFFIGYDGVDFGIMHRYGGAHETRTITITGGAGGSENLSLTLNSVLYTIPLTSGTVQHNAYEITEWLNSNQSIWDCWQNDDTVVLFALNVGALSGTYTFSSSSATGSIAQDKAGVSNTEDWIYQSSFNIDTLDGNGPSGMTLNVAKGNVYEIVVKYLGYGAVVMKIENPSTGLFFPFHRYEFANSLTTPTITNPTFKVGWVSASLGSTTNLTVKGASAMGALQGIKHPVRRPLSQTNTRTGVAATNVSILAIRCRSVFRNIAQLSEVLPKLTYVSPEGNKNCVVKILLNPIFDGTVAEPDWQYIDIDESIVEYDTTGTQFSDEGQTIASFTVSGSTTSQLVFKDLTDEVVNPLHLERGDVLCISASISGGAGNDVTTSITWLED